MGGSSTSKLKLLLRNTTIAFGSEWESSLTITLMSANKNAAPTMNAAARGKFVTGKMLGVS
jgi:hypothetical protein